MDIILLCPGGLATGGTEGIHNLCHTLNEVGANAKILYTTHKSDPQPKEFAKYECDYITILPKGYRGVVVFPEVWADQVINEEFNDCTVAINWQGVDVYDWNVSPNKRHRFLQRKNVIHIANSEYAKNYLEDLGLRPVKIADCLNDDFYGLPTGDFDRKDVVLYNPVSVKMTHFQEVVMSKCNTELGIRFRMLEGYSRKELIDIFQHSKLYIDFGVFSGRERLPREAVMCGCNILTSRLGTAGYYADNSIPLKYKMTDVLEAVKMVKYMLNNYYQCKPDFDDYRVRLKAEKENYINDIRRLYEVFDNYTST